MRAQREPAAGGGREGATAVAAVRGAIDALPRGRWLLAVSGGRDSMVLLDAMASWRPSEVAAVATFDHGTGAAARRAVRLVERMAAARGLACVSGAVGRIAPTERSWRAARGAFLAGWAGELGATVLTAHTRDDEIETVVLRLLRGAGPRGLAGMRAEGARAGAAPSPQERGNPHTVRPLLALPRATVAACAAARGIRWAEDPSNQSTAHQRNRVRLELLPALEQAAPGFSAWCWDLGARAAAWRAAVESCVDGLGIRAAASTSVLVPAAPLTGVGPAGWAILWPAIAARAGVVMDRRGIARAARWAPTARPGQEIPLSGSARIARTAATWVVSAG